MTDTLSTVRLSYPTLLSTPPQPEADATPRSWIQLAKIGEFTSSRYGAFSITKADLRQMLHNFENITPQAPTELVIDWDHLSANPRSPGDGAAAGWMKQLELRDNGETLWAEVEWTPRAVAAIQTKEYRFVSPSFVLKTHTHKDGTDIGSTLLGAAITNSPFLEGMSALVLCSSTAARKHRVRGTGNRAPSGRADRIARVACRRPRESPGVDGRGTRAGVRSQGDRGHGRRSISAAHHASGSRRIRLVPHHAMQSRAARIGERASPTR